MPLLSDGFSKNETSPPQSSQLLFFVYEATKQVYTNVPVLSKIIFTITKIALTDINLSIHRSPVYLFAGCTEVTYLTTVFATFVRFRLSPF
jgi:hypothetical protein